MWGVFFFFLGGGLKEAKAQVFAAAGKADCGCRDEAVPSILIGLDSLTNSNRRDT